MPKSTLAKSDEVLARFEVLGEQMDGVSTKVQAQRFPSPPRPLTPREKQVVTAIGKKFKELQKARQVIGHKLDSSKVAKADTAERFRAYERLLAAIERSHGGLKELEQLLDEQAALFSK